MSCFIPQNKVLIVRPDGTWTMQDDPSNSKQILPNHYSSAAWSPVVPINVDEGVLVGPPDSFPHKRELRDKLNQCLEHGVISTCCHRHEPGGLYQLEIQLPYDPQRDSSWHQYKMFVRVMEDKYNFQTISEEKVVSRVSADQFIAVKFQFDPRKQTPRTKT